jgi:hypothetical protein
MYTFCHETTVLTGPSPGSGWIVGKWEVLQFLEGAEATADPSTALIASAINSAQDDNVLEVWHECRNWCCWRIVAHAEVLGTIRRNDNRGRGWNGAPTESLKNNRGSFLGRRGDLLKDDSAVGARVIFRADPSASRQDNSALE